MASEISSVEDEVEEAVVQEGAEPKEKEKTSKKKRYGELLRGSNARVAQIDEQIQSCQDELRAVRERREKRLERLRLIRERQREYESELKKNRELQKYRSDAATRIQALVRGYFIRKYFRLTVATKKEAQQLQCQRLQLNTQLQHLRHCVHDLQHVEAEQQDAAVHIQAWWRGILARHLVRVLHVHRRVQDIWDEMEGAATRIQSQLRGHSARNMFKALEKEVRDAARKRARMELEMSNRSVLIIQRAARGFLGRKKAMRRRDFLRRELDNGDEEPAHSKKTPNRGGETRSDRGDRGDGEHRDGGHGNGRGRGDRSADHERQRGGDHSQWNSNGGNHKSNGSAGQGKRRAQQADDKRPGATAAKSAKRHSARHSTKRVGGGFLPDDPTRVSSDSSDGPEEGDHSDERGRHGASNGADRHNGNRKDRRSRRDRPRKVKRGSASRGSPDRDSRDDDGEPSSPPRDVHAAEEMPERSIAAVSVLAASLFDVSLQKAAVELVQVAAAPKELPLLSLENMDVLHPNPRYKEVAQRLFESYF